MRVRKGPCNSSRFPIRPQASAREQPSAGRSAVRGERSKGQRSSGTRGLDGSEHHYLHPSTPNPRVEPTALSRWPAKVFQLAAGVLGSGLGPGLRCPPLNRSVSACRCCTLSTACSWLIAEPLPAPCPAVQPSQGAVTPESPELLQNLFAEGSCGRACASFTTR